LAFYLEYLILRSAVCKCRYSQQFYLFFSIRVEQTAEENILTKK